MKNRKSMFKKTIALAVALVMCVTMLPTAVFAATNETADLTISTADELVAFAANVNSGTTYEDELIVLSGDINMSGVVNFTPIGTWDHPFLGTFDGQGHIIENLSVSIENGDTNIRAGLFGCVGDDEYEVGGAVQNFTIKSAIIENASTSNSGGTQEGKEAAESSTGIAVATLRWGTVNNITTTPDCRATGYYRTGGIVGDVRGANNVSVISMCVNNATVVGNNLYTGGIVGAAHDVSLTPSVMGSTIENCTNNGSVTAANNGSNVGGIVGYADRATITNCKNSGVITGLGNYGTGGIVGCNVYNIKKVLTYFSDPVTSIINNCTNEVTGEVNGGRAGGILGAFVAAPGEDAPRKTLVCTLTDCVNKAPITGTVGKCGAFYGQAITYKSGDAPTTVANMVVNVTGERTSNTGTVNGATPDGYGPSSTAAY